MTTDPCPNNYDVIHPKTSGILGFVQFYPGIKGWLFVSQVSSHGNGRTPRTFPEQAIPRWAKKMGAKLA